MTQAPVQVYDILTHYACHARKNYFPKHCNDSKYQTIIITDRRKHTILDIIKTTNNE